MYRFVFVTIVSAFVATAAVAKNEGEIGSDKSNATIDVVGICAPLDRLGWWGIDGESLDEPPQLSVAKPEFKMETKPLEVGRLVVLKATVSPSATLKTQIPNQKWTIRLPESVDGIPWKELKEQAEDAKSPVPLDAKQVVYGIGVAIVAQQSNGFTSARVAVADGDWGNVASRPRRANEGNAIQFDLATLIDGDARAVHAATKASDVRVMAEDKSGKMHVPKAFIIIAANDQTVLNYHVRFDIPGADIASYHLESRPFQWYEFSDLPLHGGNVLPADRIRHAGGVFAGDLDVLTAKTPNESPTSLDWCDVHDAQLALLADVPSLRRVYVASNWMTDAGVSQIAAAIQVEHLQLISPHVTSKTLSELAASRAITLEVQGESMENIQSDDLVALSSNPNLAHLHLWSTELTDDNLAALGQMRNLRSIVALGSEVTDEGLAKLSGLTDLETISLGVTKCSAAGFARLQTLTQLKQLDIRGHNVDDDALQSIAKLKSLQRLNLSNCDVGDQGLGSLLALTNLQRIDLTRTRATRLTFTTLAKKFDGVRVELPPPPRKAINVSLQVREADGKPIPNTKVFAFYAGKIRGGSNPWGLGLEPARLGQTKTDEQGNCILAVPAERKSDSLWIWASTADGRLQVAEKRLSGGEKMQITIPADKMRLRIVDSDGNPLAGIEVSATRLKPGRIYEFDLPYSIFDQVKWGVTDDEGRVELSGVGPERVAVIGFRGERIGNQATGWRRGFPKDKEIVIALRDVVDVRGQVESEVLVEQWPFAGFMYTERFDKVEGCFTCARYTWTPLALNDRGSVVNGKLGSGSVRFADRTPNDDNHMQLDFGRQTIATDQLAFDQPAVLSPRAVELVEVRGAVRLIPTWQLAANYTFRLRHGRTSQDWSRSESITTDRSGRFKAMVIPGQYDLQLSSFYESHMPIESFKWRGKKVDDYWTTPADRHAVEIVPLELAQAIERRGQVVDAAGKPMRTSVYGFPTDKLDETMNCVGTDSNADGYFEMTYPHTHPPKRWQMSSKQPLQVKQLEPLVLTPVTEEKSE